MKNLKKLTAMTVLAVMSAVNISVYANPNNPSLAIMYHEICTNKKDETAFIITASAFENDIKYLILSSFTVLFNLCSVPFTSYILYLLLSFTITSFSL